MQFAIENEDCINSTWNNLDRVFFICPSGTGCRIAQKNEDITITPNPAYDRLALHNLDLQLGSNYKMILSDLSGRQVSSMEITSNEMIIPPMLSGMYIATLLQDNQRIFVTKLIIAQ